MLRHIGNKTVHKIHTIRSGMAVSHDCHYMPAVQITFAKPIQHQWGVIAIRQPHRIIIICIVQRPYAVSIHKISLPARLLKNGSTISPVKKLIGKSHDSSQPAVRHLKKIPFRPYAGQQLAGQRTVHATKRGKSHLIYQGVGHGQYRQYLQS